MLYTTAVLRSVLFPFLLKEVSDDIERLNLIVYLKSQIIVQPYEENRTQG